MAGSPAKVSIAAGQVRELATVTLRPRRSFGPGRASAIARLKSPAAIPGLTPQAIAASASGHASGGTGAIAGTVTGGGKPLSKVCVLACGPQFRPHRHLEDRQVPDHEAQGRAL